jgi:pimeloyl-ACP methyl ester carboxylesterase
MGTDPIHHTVSDDGTEIAGRVHGQGPALVLLHAGLGDGDLDCGALVPHLAGRFTCYLPSTRNRGLSGHSPDLSPERHVEDVTAFIESIGEPVGLVAASGGAITALGAAAHSSAVAAVAVYEPIVPEALGEEEGAGFEAAFTRMAELAGEDRLADAARAMMGFLADDEELSSFEASDHFAAAGRFVPVGLEQIQQAFQAELDPTDPSELAKVSAPVLILHGSQAKLRWFTDGVRHVAEHVARSEVREIPAVGHHAFWVRPEPVVDELIRFLDTEHAGV